MDKVILGYQIEKEIGKGSFATVYQVKKENVSGRYVRALKHITIPTQNQYISVLNSMGGSIDRTRQFFDKVLAETVDEIKLLNTFTEQGVRNIVSYYENDIRVIESPPRYDIYILMELLTPLPQYMMSNAMTVKDVIRLGKEVLEALKYCHRNFVIHRDIKEDNLFVANDGTFKLGDFGVSKRLVNASKAESIKGTANYIAPDVYLGKEAYDSTVDLYSLGIVLYRLLNYSRNPFMPEYPMPFDTADEDKAFEKRMRGEIPEYPKLAQNVLGEVVVKALKGRTERYQSAEEFQIAIRKAEQLLRQQDLDQKIREECLTDDVQRIYIDDATMAADYTMRSETANQENRTLFLTFSDTEKEEEKEIEGEKKEKETFKKKKRIRLFLTTVVLLVSLIAAGCFMYMKIKEYSNVVNDHKEVSTMEESIIPYADIRLDMSLSELQERYTVSGGKGNQYYVEIVGSGGDHYFLIVSVKEEIINSVSMGLPVTDLQSFLNQMAGFYMFWECKSKEFPICYEKDGTQVIITYDEEKAEAYLSASKIAGNEREDK